MGVEQSIQQCRTDCNEMQKVYCEGNGDPIQAGQTEVVDLAGMPNTKKWVDVKGVARGTRQFEVMLHRVGDHWRTLGLLVSPDDDPNYLIVDDVWQPSLVAEWNARNPEDKQVRPGDIILSVNGIGKSGEAMLNQIQGSGRGSKLHLLLQSES
mmetsp:Transcript_8593/g.19103  ORF Transcript_8593/g.19103 Transcript_8593/m.19103 type:complete len:153 (+) Transcript_8593:92-550(+)